MAITLALGTPADIYLIDEPSAYLDSEQRIVAAKARSLSPLFLHLLSLPFVVVGQLHLFRAFGGFM